MTVPRLLAIGVILIAATFAWFTLAGSVEYRTMSQDGKLEGAVGELWGAPQRQQAPTFTGERGGEKRKVELVGSDLNAKIDLDQRRKGLLWYATYAIDFRAAYRVKNPGSTAIEGVMRFDFPTADGVYDGFAVKVDGREVPVSYERGSARARFPLAGDGTVLIETGYRTGGMDEWRYVPIANGGGVAAIRDFNLDVRTDFPNIDYPRGTISPTRAAEDGDGKHLTWHYDSLVSGREIAVEMPKPLNPGPVASRISYFAPVSLLFFFAALVLLTTTGGVRLHPVNYGFLAAAFFAFHLLFAYLADRVDTQWAFVAASLTSLALVVGYLRLVLHDGRVVAEVAAHQFVYLVLFSYSFFFEGLTGLAVTIGSIITLAYFMARTGKVDWEEAFARSRDSRRLDPPVPPIPPSAPQMPQPAR